MYRYMHVVLSRVITRSGAIGSARRQSLSCLIEIATRAKVILSYYGFDITLLFLYLQEYCASNYRRTFKVF